MIDMRVNTESDCWLKETNHYWQLSWMLLDKFLAWLNSLGSFKIQWNSNRNTTLFIQENALKNVCEMATILSRGRWVNSLGPSDICVSKLSIIGSDNGLSPGRRQAIIRNNAGILLIRPLGTNFSEILIEILIFSFKKMSLKVLSAKRRPFCRGPNVLKSSPSKVPIPICTSKDVGNGGWRLWPKLHISYLSRLEGLFRVIHHQITHHLVYRQLKFSSEITEVYETYNILIMSSCDATNGHN